MNAIELRLQAKAEHGERYGVGHQGAAYPDDTASVIAWFCLLADALHFAGGLGYAVWDLVEGRLVTWADHTQ